MTDAALVQWLLTAALMALDRWGFHVPPCFAANDAPDGTAVNPIMTRDGGDALSTDVTCVHFQHVSLCKFGLIVRSTKRTTTVVTSAFGRHIRQILFLRRRKQVIRATAEPHVAAMAYGEFDRDRAINDSVGETVCQVVATAIAKIAITTRGLTACPEPAFSSSINTTPKILRERHLSSWRHSRIISLTNDGVG